MLGDYHIKNNLYMFVYLVQFWDSYWPIGGLRVKEYRPIEVLEITIIIALDYRGYTNDNFILC